ncbi:MAG: tRNA (adenosine(37)-N6)-threonylcarbamoyltransferase complex dimerization subunit type 1 TsaB [Aeromonas sp.]
MSAMKILAVDTATEACSAALLCVDEAGNERVYARWEEAPRDHTKKILPMVQSVLDEAGVRLTELSAIAFGQGPGSFTGVRIGISVAQGLAFGVDVPLIGISTLAAMAQGAWAQHNACQVLAAIDARMDEVYLGAYQLSAGVMQPLQTEVVSRPDELAAQWLPQGEPLAGVWHSAGTGFDVYAEPLSALACQVEHSAVRLPRAEDMLPLAKAKWLAGEVCAAHEATPVYLRDKVTWKKLPGRE